MVEGWGEGEREDLAEDRDDPVAEEREDPAAEERQKEEGRGELAAEGGEEGLRESLARALFSAQGADQNEMAEKGVGFLSQEQQAVAEKKGGNLKLRELERVGQSLKQKDWGKGGLS
ncbi:hypothetical protein PHLCEN_2v2568 [Hermanssonia centrifuga]|uniref:Uncharacterized protein n=1 Tax=Hermanssonia centrifuga TaxID=98765 RepID=A0A2R6RLJ4_9APHY|nr:hypothetical protein PHLCEN_2v2568 [Hermanssonia centrifuga]